MYIKIIPQYTHFIFVECLGIYNATKDEIDIFEEIKLYRLKENNQNYKQLKYK